MILKVLSNQKDSMILKQRRFQADIRKRILHHEDSQALEQAAQRVFGISIL